MIQIAVCDDQPVIAEQMEKLIVSMNEKRRETDYVVTKYYGADDFLFDAEEEKHFDIVFMDIELAEKNGIQVLKTIRSKYPKLLIVFVSAHTEYMMDVFSVHPYDFIRKPIQEEKFEQVLRETMELCDDGGVLEYSFRKANHRTRLKDIVYLESEGRKIYVHHQKGTDEFYARMKDIEEELQDKSRMFFRISKSMIINIRYLEKISYTDVVIRNREIYQTFTIGGTYRSKVRQAYLELKMV